SAIAALLALTQALEVRGVVPEAIRLVLTVLLIAGAHAIRGRSGRTTAASADERQDQDRRDAPTGVPEIATDFVGRHRSDRIRFDSCESPFGQLLIHSVYCPGAAASDLQPTQALARHDDGAAGTTSRGAARGLRRCHALRAVAQRQPGPRRPLERQPV